MPNHLVVVIGKKTLGLHQRNAQGDPVYTGFTEEHWQALNAIIKDSKFEDADTPNDLQKHPTIIKSLLLEVPEDSAKSPASSLGNGEETVTHQNGTSEQKIASPDLGFNETLHYPFKEEEAAALLNLIPKPASDLHIHYVYSGNGLDNANTKTIVRLADIRQRIQPNPSSESKEYHYKVHPVIEQTQPFKGRDRWCSVTMEVLLKNFNVYTQAKKKKELFQQIKTSKLNQEELLTELRESLVDFICALHAQHEILCDKLNSIKQSPHKSSMRANLSPTNNVENDSPISAEEDGNTSTSSIKKTLLKFKIHCLKSLINNYTAVLPDTYKTHNKLKEHTDYFTFNMNAPNTVTKHNDLLGEITKNSKNEIAALDKNRDIFPQGLNAAINILLSPVYLVGTVISFGALAVYFYRNGAPTFFKPESSKAFEKATENRNKRDKTAVKVATQLTR